MSGSDFDFGRSRILFGSDLKEVDDSWALFNDSGQIGTFSMQQLPRVYGAHTIHRLGAETNSAQILLIPHITQHFLVISRSCFQHQWARLMLASKICCRFTLFQKVTQHKHSHSHLIHHLNLICRTITFKPEAMSAEGAMEGIILDGAADPARNLKRARVEGEDSEEEVEGGGKMEEDIPNSGKPLEGADGDTGSPTSKAPENLEEGMKNLLSPGAQAIHDKRESLRAELARIDEEERQRNLSKQPGLVATAGGAPEGGPSGVNEVARARAANVRVFGPHVPLLSTTCPPAFSIAALHATNRALKSAVHSARGAPRKIGSVVPNLLSRVRDVATAATVHSFSKTLGLRTDYARRLQCKKIFSMTVEGGLQKTEVASFVKAGLPNSVLVAEIGAAGKSGSSLAYPEMSIFLEGKKDAPVQVSTSPMAGPDDLESVYALLEGPDLVGLSESGGSLTERILANLEQAERKGDGHKAAEAEPGAPLTRAKAIHGRL
jgi:hypothetical protein